MKQRANSAFVIDVVESSEHSLVVRQRLEAPWSASIRTFTVWLEFRKLIYKRNLGL